jgi:hypothetical protein
MGGGEVRRVHSNEGGRAPVLQPVAEDKEPMRSRQFAHGLFFVTLVPRFKAW